MNTSHNLLLTKLLWCSLEEKNNILKRDLHHLMPEMCSLPVQFL